MSNNYITDYLQAGADPTAEDVFVLSSTIRRAFLTAPSVYFIDTVTIHLGHYDRERRQVVLDTADKESPENSLPWMRESVKGTYYGNRVVDFGPLERDGIHFTDAKRFTSNDPEYAENVTCIVLSDSFADLAQSPAVGFNVFGTAANRFSGGVTYYLSGDSRLLHLPYEKLGNAEGSLAEFALAHGELVHFNLLHERAELFGAVKN